MNTEILERQSTYSKNISAIGIRSNISTSKCTFCQHYKLQRGSVGHCQLLNAPVRGGWKACSQAIGPFAPSWEHIEGGLDLPARLNN
ncbi:MAG: hypothetical protein MUE44_07155 [Oscillatoriaceae cyanobacterium Prado104]|jgi:hypothetical protein|nr:hypothetical protein [Oscillatoriaceae cyanobacterium Prado104]